MSHNKKLQYDNVETGQQDIAKFIKSYQINLAEAERAPEEYKSLNDFFTRRLKPGLRPLAAPDDDSVVVSAADCRLRVFSNVNDATRLYIKQRHFSIRGLLGSGEQNVDAMAKSFTNGSIVIFRLAPNDYHRFHSPVQGKVVSIHDSGHDYFSVKPMVIENGVPVFTQNKRRIVLLRSPLYGDAALVIVGATEVASIHLDIEVNDTVEKGQELGYFAYGGSTVVLLFQSDRINWDEDILKASRGGVELYVRVGEQLGQLTRAGAGEDDDGGPRRRRNTGEGATN